ncbi:MAG: acetyl-CoA carboxylase biotin carboxyl carrier protein subunit, partial [Actinomadura sp.]
AEVSVGGGDPVGASARYLPDQPTPTDLPWRGRGGLVVTYAARTVRYACARAGDICWLGHGGRAWALTEHTVTAALGDAAHAAGGVLRSPMPGTVLAVKAAEGDQVTAGQPLVVVEAMKMEHTVVAPVDGVLTRLPVRPGTQVALDETLAEIDERPPGGSQG